MNKIILLILLALLVLSGCLSNAEQKETALLDSGNSIESNVTSHQKISYYYNYDDSTFVIKFLDENACIEVHSTTGTSMLPYSKYKSMVLIDFCFDPEKLELNDTIVFYKQRTLKLVHHRIIEIDYDKKAIVTKGDNSQFSDEEIRFDQVLGKVIGAFNTTYEERQEQKQEEAFDFNGDLNKEFLIDSNKFTSNTLSIRMPDYNATMAFSKPSYRVVEIEGVYLFAYSDSIYDYSGVSPPYAWALDSETWDLNETETDYVLTYKVKDTNSNRAEG